MDCFPYNPLTPINGQPTAFTLTKLKRELVANARSVASSRGTGRHGHLILVLTPEEYTAVTNGAVYEEPNNPGPRPTYPAQASNAQIHAIDTDHKYRSDEYNKFVEVQSGIMKLLLAAVKEPYYSKLKDPLFDYLDVTPRELLAHLTTTYGTVTANDLFINKEVLQAPWNPSDPINSLWDRIRTCQDFARNTMEPLTEAMIILLATKAISASGVMAQYLNEWNRFDPARKTWDNFTEHFDRAEKQRLQELTTQQAGYHNANYTAPKFDSPTHQAHATPPQPSTTCPPAAPSTHTYTVPIATGENNTVTWSYCWTHGLGKNLEHTSATCKTPSPGHQQDATILKMKGGSTTIQTFTRRPPTNNK